MRLSRPYLRPLSGEGKNILKRTKFYVDGVNIMDYNQINKTGHSLEEKRKRFGDAG